MRASGCFVRSSRLLVGILLIIGCGGCGRMPASATEGSGVGGETAVRFDDVPGDVCQQASRQAADVRTETIAEIEVTGTEGFRDCTRAALKVLRQTTAFAGVHSRLRRMQQAGHSGMRLTGAIRYWMSPTYEVAERTWRRSVVWYAGSIVHDGCHAARFSQGKAWAGAEGERACLEAQRSALKQLSAPESLIAYVESLIANPTYQDIEYDRRDW